jgi:hypothetical protein
VNHFLTGPVSFYFDIGAFLPLLRWLRDVELSRNANLDGIGLRKANGFLDSLARAKTPENNDVGGNDVAV